MKQQNQVHVFQLEKVKIAGNNLKFIYTKYYYLLENKKKRPKRRFF